MHVIRILIANTEYFAYFCDKQHLIQAMNITLQCKYKKTVRKANISVRTKVNLQHLNE